MFFLDVVFYFLLFFIHTVESYLKGIIVDPGLAALW